MINQLNVKILNLQCYKKKKSRIITLDSPECVPVYYFYIIFYIGHILFYIIYLYIMFLFLCIPSNTYIHG